MPYMGVCSGFFHKYLGKGPDAVKDSPYYTDGDLTMVYRVLALWDIQNAMVSQVVLGAFGQRDIYCAPLYGRNKAERIKEAMTGFAMQSEKGENPYAA